MKVADKIRTILGSGTHTPIEITEGVDKLCKVCMFCHDNLCQSPQGDENQVRKLDGIIMSGLDIKYGDVLTVDKYQAMIKSKAPIPFCKNRCGNRTRCKPGAIFQ